ncbi:hypothetical protein RND81_10G004500 [Saponaria officinalis]|uniref:F-box/LRR-repeat protein 15/At3g58940/PEG3-like LRR domain-containing protein n=1 Tax=Saponaria officinalis TaxID=3572 RepID=A0AAW1HX26_SAPOF
MFQDSFVRYNTLVGLLVAPKISEFQMTFELQRPTLVMPQEDFTLNKWVGLLNSKHVEHLCVIKTHDGGLRMSSFPHSTYRIATLVSLTLAWPTKMTLPKDIYLPSLKTWEHVIEQYRKWGKLSTLIKRCPRLEDLILKVFVSKDTKHEVWKLGCCNQHLKTMHMSRSVDNVSSRKKIILTLEVPSLERIVIHLNRRLQIVWKTPTKKLKVRKIYKEPDITTTNEHLGHG